MSRNGSGTYSLPAGNPVVTGTTISSTWANNTLSDIATALTGSIAADGQTAITANLPMSGYKHTGVGAATARGQYARIDEVQDGTATYLTSVSGTDTISASATPSLTAYAAGQVFRFVAAGANTGAATLNINGLGAKSITKNGASALSAGDISSGAVITVVYDGTRFQIFLVVSLGSNTFTGLQTFAAGANIASATTVDLTAATGNCPRITGTTTTTALTMNEGQQMMLVADAAWPLTYHATTLNISTGANYTCTAGENLFAYKDDSGVVHVIPLGAAQSLTRGSAVASTSGTAIDFTSIPSTAQRVTVMLSGVSTNGTSTIICQIGDSGGVETSGYLSRGGSITSTPAVSDSGEFTTAFNLGGFGANTDTISGTMVLVNLNGNEWIASGTFYRKGSTSSTNYLAGTKTLSATLDRVRITSTSGDTFDAGTINIMWE